MDSRFRVGAWTVDPASGEIEGPSGRVAVGARALTLLADLASHSGETRTRQQLLEAVWPGEAAGADELSECIGELQRSLGEAEAGARHVEAVGDRGYRLVAAVTWLDPDSRPGERFEVRDQIGSGGMGVVYRGVDRRLQRTVALKYLPPEWGRDPKAKERFLVEARAAAALDHPNICPVHEISETAEGRLFLVMPYYDGGSLKDRCAASGPLPVDEALRVARQAARGLAHAHAAGIVHRDIKPGNLMLAADGTVKILDFGLAKFGAGQGLTATGALMGTPAYMSPEQARGAEVDARTDIWSLGVVLFEMLTGRRPFTGDNDLSVLRAIIDADLTTPLGAGVPAPIRRIVSRMLESDPARRYLSCSELLRDLDSVTTDATAVTAVMSQDGALPTTPAPARRPPLWAVSLGALALLVVAVVGWRAWRGDESAPPTSTVPSGSTAHELTQSARRQLSKHYDETAVGHAITGFDAALRLDGDYAPALAGLAEAYRRLHDINNDDVQLSRALASAERAVELNAYLAAARVSLGLVLVATGEPDRGERELRKALELDPLAAAAHRELGVALWKQKDGAGARSELIRALELDPDDWWAWTQLGSLAFAEGRYGDAEDAFRRSTELTPQNPWAFRNLAGAMQMQQRYDEAAGALQASLEIHPSDSTYSNLGTLLFVQGKFGSAVEAFERAVDLNPNNHLYWGNLGDAYRWAPGRRGDAPTAFRHASALAEDFLAADASNSTVRSRLALYQAKAGDAQSAIANLERVLASGPPDANGWYRALLTYELAGERERALETLAEVLAAGYPLSEIEQEPELIELRRDRRYHETVLAPSTSAGG